MAQNLISVRPSAKDLGGFSVRRALPSLQKRAISFFVFLDHMGPAEISRDTGMNVRPHPHIALATVTFLFSGRITHRDSLGSVQVIEPGDVNWMTAGRGIVHSERTPHDGPEKIQMHGLQIWVALPKEREEMSPSFHHHASQSLPEFKKDDAELKLILGTFMDQTSPVKLESEIFYLDARMQSGGELNLEFRKDTEVGIYLIRGTFEVSEQNFVGEPEVFNPETLVVLQQNKKYLIKATSDCHFVFFGGEPMPEPRHMWWNFISTSKERIEEAKRAWSRQEMGQVPGETEFIPLPEI